MSRPRRLLLLLSGSVAGALLVCSLLGAPGPLRAPLSYLGASVTLRSGLCESLRSLGDLAEWVARQNETPVCWDTDADPLYRRLPDGGFPLCRLRPPPPWLEERIRAGSVSTWVSVGPEAGALMVPVLGYSGHDLITQWLVDNHSWESHLVRPLLERLMRLGRGNATLLDIGCNIGAYALQAAALGFPVVAVDANARNLARVGLALREPTLAAAGAPARVTLVWNFIAAAAQREPVRLNYPADCNIGGATRFARDVADPVAVMPTGGDALARLVGTQVAVLKLDAEGGEADFVRTSRQLFANLTVAAVQMEWLPRHHLGTDSLDIVKFFNCRDYSLHSVDGKLALDVLKPQSWPSDILWLHKDFKWLL